MAVSNHYLNRILHRLSQVVPVSYRRIFTGVGIYHQGQLFALITNNRTYFRVDEDSVEPYRERAMPALKPAAAFLPGSHFYQLPDEVLHNPAELMFWMRAAVEASQTRTLSLETEASATSSLSQTAITRRTFAG